MMDDRRLQELLRSVFPPTPDAGLSRNLWPSVVSRVRAPVRVSWIDITLAAVLATLLMLVPGGLWLLAYHF